VFRNTGLVDSQGVKTLENWLAIELLQTENNRQAIGARIEIITDDLTQVRTVSVGGGHASGSNGFMHVGLGDATRAAVRVRWPDGSWSTAYSVVANRHATLERNATEATYWNPGKVR